MINGRSGMQTRSGGNCRRNITKEQQRKCIYMRLGDFEDVIRKVSLDVWVSYTQNKISPDTYGEKPFDKQRYLLELSRYFDVTVTGVHIDLSENKGAWIEYAETDNSVPTPCGMCFNSRFDDELTDENDFASYSIGHPDKNYRMMYTSGYGKPPRIEFDAWNESCRRWDTVGVYFPKCCPECGREITEYNEKRRKD